jgi:hypothetical protein
VILRELDIPGAVVYRFEDDRMTNETISFDLATRVCRLRFTTMEL